MNARVLAQPKPAAKSVVPPVYSNLVLQRRATDRDPVTAVPPIVHDVLNSSGQPLDSATRAFMEPRFGHDFGHVRVHNDEKAADSARAVHAHAYTVGHNVVFGENRYAPTTQAGRELLAHELTHTIQQRNSSGAPPSSDPSGIFESSAIAAGRSIAGGGLLARDLPVCGIGLARQQDPDDDEEPIAISMRLGCKPVAKPKPAPHKAATPSKFLPGGFSDEDIYAPLTEAKEREKQERPYSISREIAKLRRMTKEWSKEDRKFAEGLLLPILRANINPDPRGVSDAIQQPLLDRYEKWLRAVDKREWRNAPPLALSSSSRTRAHGEDPCKSWFEDEYSHGPEQLRHLARVLRIFRGSSESAAEQVYWDVFEYRRLTDSKMILAGMIGQGLVGIGTNIAAVHGGALMSKTQPGAPPPPPGRPPVQTIKASPPPASEAPSAVPLELATTAQPSELAKTASPIELTKTAQSEALGKTAQPAELAKTATPEALAKTAPGTGEQSPLERTQPSAPPAARAPAGAAGRAPVGRVTATPVSTEEVAAALRADPNSVRKSWHPTWHEQMWLLDGGNGPAPRAFRAGRVIIVDPDFPLP